MIHIETIIGLFRVTFQVRLDTTNDKLWENLYWTPELTRPDRLAKVLNSIVRKESSESDHFIYNRHAAKDAMKVDLTKHDISQTGMTQHDISGIDLSQNNIDQIDLNLHDINNFNSLRQLGNRAHLTHHDKRRLGQFDKLLDSHSRSSSSSNVQNNSGDTKGEFDLFEVFKFGGGSNTASQTQSQTSNNQTDISDKEHGRISDTDLLNVTRTGQHNLNVIGTGKNLLNTT